MGEKIPKNPIREHQLNTISTLLGKPPNCPLSETPKPQNLLKMLVSCTSRVYSCNSCFIEIARLIGDLRTLNLTLIIDNGFFPVDVLFHPCIIQMYKSTHLYTIAMIYIYIYISMYLYVYLEISLCLCAYIYLCTYMYLLHI